MGQSVLYDVFFVIGAVLIIGFFSSQIFERTKFPDVIILMFIGMLLGPILNIVSVEGTISTLARTYMEGFLLGAVIGGTSSAIVI